MGFPDIQDKYPVFKIHEEDGDPKFIKVVQDALAKIYESDFKILDEDDRHFFRRLKSFGVSFALGRYILETHNKFDISSLPDDEQYLGIICNNLCEKIMDNIPEGLKPQFFPFNAFRICYRDNQVGVSFERLLIALGDAGLIFYSKRRPQIEFKDQSFVVGFSKHAIARVCERLAPDFFTYPGLAKAFHFFSFCVYFKPIYLPNKQPAFVLFSKYGGPNDSRINREFLESLGSKDFDPLKGEWCRVLGYCPVVFESGFAVAKTFLIPGFTSTPEYDRLLNSHLPHNEKERFIRLAKDSVTEELDDSEKFEVFKWFHDNGVPQVMQVSQQVFDRS